MRRGRVCDERWVVRDFKHGYRLFRLAGMEYDGEMLMILLVG